MLQIKNILLLVLPIIVLSCAKTGYVNKGGDWRTVERIPVYKTGEIDTSKYTVIKEMEHLICTPGKLGIGGGHKGHAESAFQDTTSYLGGNVVVEFKCKDKLEEIRLNCTSPVECKAFAAKLK